MRDDNTPAVAELHANGDEYHQPPCRLDFDIGSEYLGGRKRQPSIAYLLGDDIEVPCEPN